MTTAGLQLERKRQSQAKKQKHFLSDSLKKPHSKFLLEQPQVKLFYSLFCRMRPYWIVFPTVQDRDTCLCKVHENAQLNRLHQHGVISTQNLERIVEDICCDTKNQTCMHRMCEVCNEKTLQHDLKKIIQIYMVVWMGTADRRVWEGKRRAERKNLCKQDSEEKMWRYNTVTFWRFSNWSKTESMQAHV